jgi:hypothetical protein
VPYKVKRWLEAESYEVIDWASVESRKLVDENLGKPQSEGSALWWEWVTKRGSVNSVSAAGGG